MHRPLLAIILLLAFSVSLTAQTSGVAYRFRGGTAALRPATCKASAPADQYYATDTDVEYICTATNTWGILASAASGGGVLTSPITIGVGQTTTATTDLLINPTTKASGLLLGASVNSVSKFSVDFAGAVLATSYNGVTLKQATTRAYNNAALVLGTGVFTTLTFNSERWDTDTMHDTGSNTGRITFTTAGTYVICFNGRTDPTAGIHTIVAQIRLNGTTVLGSQHSFETGAGTDHRVTVTTIWQAAANDYVEIQIYQATGGNLNLQSVADESPEFSAVRVSN